MSTRTLQQIIPAITVSDGGGVKLHRSLGQHQQLRVDPFLMLDEFSSNNADDFLAGFPDHPHRGFQTVTYMLDGHMLHQDHLGNQGHLKSGGVQWMTAGRGIIHSEMPQQDSGRMHGFQLWINLPAQQKMQIANYRDFQPEEIPLQYLPSGGSFKIIAGRIEIDGNTSLGPIQETNTDTLYLDVRLPAGGHFEHSIPIDHNAFIYLYEGTVLIGPAANTRLLKSQNAGVLSKGNHVEILAGDQNTAFLLLTGRPIHEPISQYGPFVMNTREEIEQAMTDYNNGQLV